MSQPCEIRRLEPDEWPLAIDLLALLNPLVPPDVVAGRLSDIRATHPHYQLAGAWVAGRLAGVCGGWLATKIWCGHHMEIDNLVVDPDFRGQGIGEALMRHFETIAAAEGCRAITLDAYATNHAAHRLYVRLGYETWSFHFVKPIGDWQGAGGG
jgi:ribosomal protein S18 acetylase RimI-like enzyme